MLGYRWAELQPCKGRMEEERVQTAASLCCTTITQADRGFFTRPRNGRGRTGLSDHSVLTWSRACTKEHPVHVSDSDKRR